MRIGLMMAPWEFAADYLTVARLAEERDVESFWLGEHSHWPVDGPPDASGFHRRQPDPYTVLAGIAAATTTMRIGTATGLPAEEEPLALAKRVATLDQLSSGRLEWGIGYGWNRPEMRNRGLLAQDRMGRLRETILAVRLLWENEMASFEGTHVRFSESWSRPKPAQHPGPPILLGAPSHPRCFDHLVEFCDGWLPGVQELDGAPQSLDTLRDLWRNAGRDPAALGLTFIDTSQWPARSVEEFVAQRGPLHDLARRARDVGADRLIVGIPALLNADMRVLLDDMGRLVASVA